MIFVLPLRCRNDVKLTNTKNNTEMKAIIYEIKADTLAASCIVAKFFNDSTPDKECICGEQLSTNILSIFYDQVPAVGVGGYIYKQSEHGRDLGISKMPTFDCFLFSYPSDKHTRELVKGAIKRNLVAAGFPVTIR